MVEVQAGTNASANDGEEGEGGVKMLPEVAAYYEGGYRLVRGGVPQRVARKPSKNMLAILGERKPLDPIEAQIAAASIDAPNFAYSKDGQAAKLLEKRKPRKRTRDRDGAEGGDADAAPVPQDRQARAEGIAR
jgi:hypothetical protein